MRPLVFACAAALASAFPAIAPAVSAETAVSAHRQKALALAQTVQSQEIAIDGAMAVIDGQMVDAMMADPDVKKLEAEHPGALRAMWEGAKPVMRKQLLDSLPQLWQLLAEVYAADLTDAQLDSATTFFRTPTGHKFLLQMIRRADLRPLVADGMAGEGKIRRQTWETGTTTAAVNAIGDMTATERAEIADFLVTDAGKALGAAAPDVTRTGLEWMNRTDNAAQAQVEAAMKAALHRFLASHR